MSMAIAGSDVAITVESMFSMKSATARMSGMMRFKGKRPDLSSRFWHRLGGEPVRPGGYHASARMSH
jgi:hypothetical protein